MALGGRGGKSEGGIWGAGGKFFGKVKIRLDGGGTGGRGMNLHVSSRGIDGSRLGEAEEDEKVGRRVGDLYGVCWLLTGPLEGNGCLLDIPLF